MVTIWMLTHLLNYDLINLLINLSNDLISIDRRVQNKYVKENPVLEGRVLKGSR